MGLGQAGAPVLLPPELVSPPEVEEERAPPVPVLDAVPVAEAPAELALALPVPELDAPADAETELAVPVALADEVADIGDELQLQTMRLRPPNAIQRIFDAPLRKLGADSARKCRSTPPERKARSQRPTPARTAGATGEDGRR